MEANSQDAPPDDSQGGGKEQEMAQMVLDAIEGLIPLVAQSMGKDAAATLQQAGQIIDQFVKGGAAPGGAQPAPGGSEMAGSNPNAQSMG